MPKADFQHVTEWVFDMDHTLYPANDTLFSQIEVKMTDYVAQITGFDRSQSDALRRHYWDQYGASLAGLVKHHKVDPHDFLHHVHDIDYSVLTPSPDLIAALDLLRGRKIVFTNGPRAYADRVLTQLGLQGAFDDVFGTEDCDLIPKPERRAYEQIFAKASLTPTQAAMFEDSHANLRVPHEMGMKTVLVHHTAEGDHIHHHTECLPSFLRQIA